MANVIHRITKQYLESVNTPDYPESEWIINPTLPDCDPSEWIVEGDSVRELTQLEKDAKEAKKLGEEQAKTEKELADKIKADSDKIEAREDFVALSVEEKLIFLYDTRL